MKKEGITPQYILCVALMLAVAAAACFVHVMDIYSEAVDSKISQINNETRRYDYEKLRGNALALRDAAYVTGITPSGKNAAITEILKYADFLHEKYGAVIAANPSDSGGVITVPMLMSHIPADAADFLDTLKILLKEEKPIVYISELTIELVDAAHSIYAVKMKLELSKPYLAEAE